MTQIGSFSYTLPPAIAIAAGLAIIAVVMHWAPPSRSRRAFILMVAGLVLWGATIFGMRLSTDPDIALKWDRWVGVTIIVLFLGFYSFALEYSSVFGQRRVLAAGYVALALFAALAPSSLIIEDIRVAEYGYAPVPGPLAIPASVTAVALLFAGVYVLLRRYRATSSYEEKNRLLYLIGGAALPFVGALLDVFSNLPPVGIWTNILFCGIAAVALLEYQLLDIPQVARRTLTYLVLGVTVALPYVVVVLALQRLLGERFESMWTVVLSVVVLAVLLRPLYAFAQDLVDRLFYRDRYDALRALEQFGKEIQYTVDLQAQSARLTGLVMDALRASCTCLFLPNARRSDYVLVHCEGTNLEGQGPSISARSPLMKWLSERPRILAHRMLDIEPPLQSLSRQERDLIDAIGADLLVPITSRDGQLSGLLVLGRKRSQGEYSGDDRRLLEALGRQLALSIENARLYGDAVRGRQDLENWLDAMHDSVVIIGQDQTVSFVNRAARENLSVQIGDLCSAVLGSEEACTARTIPDDWDGQQSGMRLSSHIGERDYEVVAAPLRGPNGQVTLIAVFRDITERLLFEEELRQSQEQMRELAAHVELVREEERTGIARELHDELGQLLTALKMDITWLSTHAGTQERKAISTKLDGMGALADTTMHAVQRISSELRPGLLDDLGLVAALEWLVRDYRDRSGMKCVLDVDEHLALDSQRSTALFRICQESLTNAARHSGATLVTVTLLADDGKVVLSIRDNGTGVTPEESGHPHSFGLMGMRERARAMGGELEIVGVAGKGTSVEVTLPSN